MSEDNLQWGSRRNEQYDLDKNLATEKITQADGTIAHRLAVAAIMPGAGNDAFGRLRVSDPVSIFDSQFQYDKQPLLWEESTTGSGAGTHAPDESAVDMTNTTTSADEVVRQTRAYHRYQPGKSQFILTTLVMGAADANVRMRVGYFDGENGIFLEREGTTINVVRRTNASGSVVDNEVAQASWNMDKLDGTGDSGVTLDLSKCQIFCVDLEWLGVGIVNCGFVIDGKFHRVHQFQNTNSLTTVYMTTANLPVRYEVTNTGTASSAPTLKQICCTVISEGGFEQERGFPRCTSNGVTTRAVTTRLPIIAIRPALTFNSIANRAELQFTSVNLLSQAEDVYVEVLYGATVSGGSWANVSGTAMDVNKTGTGVTGGSLLNAFYVSAASQGAQTTPGSGSLNLLSKLPLTLDIAGANPIEIAIMVTSVDAGATDCSAAVFWREQR